MLSATSRRVALVLPVALAASWPSRSEPLPTPTSSHSTPRRFYVPDPMGASVAVLDETGHLLTTVDLAQFGFSPHAMPHDVAAAPDGMAWYVTLSGDGYVVKFSRENRLLAKTKLDLPGMVVLDPKRDRLYVSRALGAVNVPSSLGIFRASDLALLDEPDVFIPLPHPLAIDTVSGRVYTSSLGMNQLATLDPKHGTLWVMPPDSTLQAFVGLAVTPDGRQLVAITEFHRLLAFDTRDPRHLALVASVAVDSLPPNVASSPVGRSAWFPKVLIDPHFRKQGISVDEQGGIHATVVGLRFSWLPAEMVLPADTPIAFRLISGDVVHGYQIVRTDGQTTMVVPGHVSQFTIRLPAGEYLITCNVYCGAGHPTMAAKLRVVPREQWQVPAPSAAPRAAPKHPNRH